jgi:hypothetical protein
MAYVAPSTVTTLQTYTSAAHNIIVNDIIDHETRINSYSGVYTNEATRDAAITSPVEGMRVYLTAPTVPAATGTTTLLPTGVQTIYNGSVWVCITEIGSQTPGTSSGFGTSYADINCSGTITSVTLVTGTTALVSYYGRISGNGNYARLSVKTGTVNSSDNWSSFNQTSSFVTIGRVFVMSGLTAGTNTFTLQAQNNVAGGNGDQFSLFAKGIA